MKIEVNINKKYAVLIFLGVFVLAGAILTYALSPGQAPPNGHTGDQIGITINGQTMTLQQAINDGDFGNGGDINIQYFENHTRGGKISGLTPNKEYLVEVYGVTANRGEGKHTLGSIGVTDCSGNVLDNTAALSINWPDGSTPQTASFLITAPQTGCIMGLTDDGVAGVLYINAISFN